MRIFSESKQLVLERLYSGHFKTSLEMHGFQICILHLNQDMGDLWLELLDAPTGAASWTGSEMSARNDEKHVDDETDLQFDGKKVTNNKIAVTTSTITTPRPSINRFVGFAINCPEFVSEAAGPPPRQPGHSCGTLDQQRGVAQQAGFRVWGWRLWDHSEEIRTWYGFQLRQFYIELSTTRDFAHSTCLIETPVTQFKSGLGTFQYFFYSSVIWQLF